MIAGEAPTAADAATGVLIELYEVMTTIRQFEQQISTQFGSGRVPGFTHSYIGMEAVATGVCALLRADDLITSTHRGHGHAIAKGVDPARIAAEIYGKATGACKGKGGSMHLVDLSHGLLGCNGIVGGGLPMTVGAALGRRQAGSDAIAVAFCGEGAVNQGVFHEALNLAAVWDAPALFVIENNVYTEYCSYRTITAVDDLAVRAAAYGIEGIVVDGQDVEAVHGTAARLVSELRAGGGPALLEARTYRFRGHHEGEDVLLGRNVYRGDEEIARMEEERDPVALCRAALVARGVAPGRLDAIDAERARVVEAAIAFAEGSAEPDPSEAFSDVLAETVRAGSS